MKSLLSTLLLIGALPFTYGCDDTSEGVAVDAATLDGGGDAAVLMDAALPGPDAAAMDPALCETRFVVSGCPCDGSEDAVCCGGGDALGCRDGTWRFSRMRACNPNVADDAGSRPRRAECDFGQ